MSQFIQLHLLTSYPPANLNRDDLGRPKTAMMGGKNRLRVSSQSLKRAWRKSDLFEMALGDHLGQRTRNMGEVIRKKMIAHGIDDKNALSWSQAIAGKFGKLKQPKDSKDKKADATIEQLAHFSPEEIQIIEQLIDTLAKRGSNPEAEELNLLRKNHQAADIALFGRMLASSPQFNTEAAVQVAHAIGVHESVVENDFFTAVDDLNIDKGQSGSAHMGETEFGAALFYLYICIDKDLLLGNLQQDTDLVNKTLSALTETTAKIAPTGKQNSFASRAQASYILAEKGVQQPRSLSVAFLNPVKPGQAGILCNAIDALETTRNNLAKVYYAGKTEDSYIINAENAEGEFAQLLNFVAG
ncbi:type I-E CRISPR-associated protein Cas7/Cse4/CasC [Candidatus Venteria ishoeyi]|uniref:CRISPR system Cascade subunit CasC n=1 Tax=Candidatus Venteria ishoeyi TaxID=1899563 RepID=A0A1H6F5T6_9GAMM|nr:type I-E CRISPR-associated protein Cas7/Cse4/CasC [Candidatus Venteria ishoeyi]SEH05472.1 CRISPR system Cascade subunit CasC [Candidatus Venteria ishoeyi]